MAEERGREGVDAEERRRAVLHLQGRPPGEAVPLLVDACRDRDWRVRKTATEMLIADYTPEDYIPGLLGLLSREDDAGGRNAAIEALIKLGKKSTPFLVAAFTGAVPDVRKFIVDIIGETRDREALPLLMTALRDEDENVRAVAVEYLGRLADARVVDELITVLGEGDVWTAFPAAEALGKIGDRRAVPALVKALSAKALREPALRALGGFADPDTLPAIVPLLTEKSRTIQEEAVKALEMFLRRGMSPVELSEKLRTLCGQDCVSVFASHARSRKPEVRSAAIILLGLLHDEAVVGPLLELSEDEELAADVKKAMILMARRSPEAILPLFPAKDEYRRRFLTAVAAAAASPLFAATFRQGLGDRDGHVRALSAAGIAALGDATAVDDLIGLLDDAYPDVQDAAVAALAVLKDRLDVGLFHRFLRSRQAPIRRNAARILGQIGDVASLPPLGFALKDDDVTVRSAVVDALANLGSKGGVRFLLFALTDEEPAIRSSAAINLGMIGGADAVDGLRGLVSDPVDMVRAAAARALGAAGDPAALDTLLDLLGDENGFVVTSAMESASAIGGSAVRDALAAMLGSADAEIRRTAITSLGSFAGVDALILPYLSDADWATRLAAVEALARNASAEARAAVEALYNREDDPVVRRSIEERFYAR